jgi:predicted PurR-regulated permease PerM
MIPNISFHSATSWGVNVFLLLAGIIALRLGQTVFVPLIMALLLAAVLGPVAGWVNRTLKVRWSLACLLVIGGLLGLNLLLTLLFIAAGSRLAQQIPSPNDEARIIQVYTNFYGRIQAWLGDDYQLDPELFPPNPEKASDIRVVQYLSEAVPQLTREAARYTGDWMLYWIIIMFTLLFLLLEGRMLTRRVVQIFGPSAEVQAKVGQVLADMAHQVRTYLVWRTIINFGLAIVMGLIYQFCGLSQAWTWAILLSILNYIPYLGPLVAGVPPFIDAVLSTSPAGAITVAVLYWTIIILEGYLVVPLLMGRSMHMNATTVMLACLFWDLVWGTTGLFLAMPIMAGLKAILYHIPEGRPWANLMSDSDEEPKPVLIPPAKEGANGRPGEHAEGSVYT